MFSLMLLLFIVIDFYCSFINLTCTTILEVVVAATAVSVFYGVAVLFSRRPVVPFGGRTILVHHLTYCQKKERERESRMSQSKQIAK